MLTNGKRSARIGNAVGTAGVAQLVEQLICNQQAGGSSPSTSSTILSISGGIPERSNGADCKSVVTDFGGSNPPSPTSSEIPATVPFPAPPKTALWWEFLRLHPRTSLLGPRLSFLRGTPLRWRRGPGVLPPFFWRALWGMESGLAPLLLRVPGLWVCQGVWDGWNYKKLGGESKIAHMFDDVKREFTRNL